MATDTVPRRLPRVSSRPLFTVVTAVATIALLMTVGVVADLGERLPASLGHGLSHLFVAAPLAWLLVSMLRRWPPAREVAPGYLGRRMSVIGVAGVVVGQVLEVAGARVDEPSATGLEAAAHTAGQVVTSLSMLVLAVGAVLALTAAARDGAVPRWLAAIIAVLMLAVFAMMMIGPPGA